MLAGANTGPSHASAVTCESAHRNHPFGTFQHVACHLAIMCHCATQTWTHMWNHHYKGAETPVNFNTADICGTANKIRTCTTMQSVMPGMMPGRPPVHQQASPKQPAALAAASAGTAAAALLGSTPATLPGRPSVCAGVRTLVATLDLAQPECAPRHIAELGLLARSAMGCGLGPEGGRRGQGLAG